MPIPTRSIGWRGRELYRRLESPIRIEGEFEICDPEGKLFGLAGRTVISLCRCGQSANKPFGDGSHGRTSFHHPVAARDLPPPMPKL
jgi:CDGSH-type Zn-finger protein